MIINLKTPPISNNLLFGNNQWMRAGLKEYFSNELKERWPMEYFAPYRYRGPYHVCYSHHNDVNMDIDNLIVIPKLFQDAIQPWFIPDDKLIRVIHMDYNCPDKGIIRIDFTCMEERQSGNHPIVIDLEIPEYPGIQEQKRRRRCKRCVHFYKESQKKNARLKCAFFHANCSNVNHQCDNKQGGYKPMKKVKK